MHLLEDLPSDIKERLDAEGIVDAAVVQNSRRNGKTYGSAGLGEFQAPCFIQTRSRDFTARGPNPPGKAADMASAEEMLIRSTVAKPVSYSPIVPFLNRKRRPARVVQLIDQIDLCLIFPNSPPIPHSDRIACSSTFARESANRQFEGFASRTAALHCRDVVVNSLWTALHICRANAKSAAR